MNGKRGDSQVWQLIDIGVAILLPIVTAVVGWSVGVFFEHAQRLSVIEASSYTKAEAKEDQKVLTDSIQDMQITLHKIDKQTATASSKIEEVQKDVKELQNR